MSSESLLDQFLEQESGLTRTQIDTLKLHKLVISGELDAKQAANSRLSKRAKRSKGVALGAYYRVVGQASTNIDQAIYTTLLATRMGLVRLEDFRRLLELVSKSGRELSDQDADEVISLLQALVKRIVML